MTTEHDGGGGFGGGRGARRPRRRALGAWAAGAVLAAAALAAADDRYPASDDAAVLDLERGWQAMVVPPAVELCTGSVTFRRTEETRDPATSTADFAAWKPLSSYATGAGTRCVTAGGVTAITHDGGGDLEARGNDGYFMYRFTACGACCFLRLVLEAEDGAWETWRIRYHGTETATVTNGADVRATALTYRDDYFVTWNRDVVNTDALVGEFDEDKEVEQDFAVRLRLVDGSEVHEGATLALTAPSAVKTMRSVGPRLEAKADDKGVGFGGSLGLSWGEEKSYPMFTSLPRAEREHTTSGSVSVTRALPCPDTATADVHTWFEGDFSIRDDETFSGSLGARQELTLAVVHQLAAVRASGCVKCPKPPPPPPVTTPSDPPAKKDVPPVTTPTEPARPSEAPVSPVPATPVPGMPLPAMPAPSGPGVPIGPLFPSDGGAPFVPLGGPAPDDGPLVPRATGGDAPCPWPVPEASPWPGPVPSGPTDPCAPFDPFVETFGDVAAPVGADGPPAGRY